MGRGAQRSGRAGTGGPGLEAHLPQVNQTFQELALLKDIQEVWEVLGPQLFTFMNNSANVARLQVRGGGVPHDAGGGPFSR